jgi:glutamate N-acetyltransferase/amino-acid N-acetyltransferase
MQPYPARQGVPGFLFSGISSGIKNNRKKDLGLILSTQPCTAAGVFTKNRAPAAPVTLCKERLRKALARIVLVNSANANACTGEQGLKDARVTCAAVSSHLGFSENLVLPCSTGVIGVPLPVVKIAKAVPRLVKNAVPGGIDEFARSILTTDTHPKIAALKDTAEGETIKVCGIAKGAGMIMPDMATMLCFIVSNAAVEKKLLSRLLKLHADETFNRITVDGDMSTNDCVLLLAGGDGSQTTITSTASKAGRIFDAMLYEVMKNLSLMIVRDGEGATKLIFISVINARTQSDAKKAAQQVANSNLVKTAFFGQDFNWGRIMAALGSSGAAFDMQKIRIAFNNIPAVKNGQAVKENLSKLKKTVKKKTIRVTIDLKQGHKGCEYTTCDLSYEYVKINADYTT